MYFVLVNKVLDVSTWVFYSFEAAKPRHHTETLSAQPLYWHSCHSHCSPSARLDPAKYPSPYHLWAKGPECHAALWRFRRFQLFALHHHFHHLSTFWWLFTKSNIGFWTFLVLHFCNCQGLVATCLPSAGQFELSALSRARAQSFGHGDHTALRTLTSVKHYETS